MAFRSARMFWRLARTLDFHFGKPTKKQINYIKYLSKNKRLPKKLKEKCKTSELKKLTRAGAYYLINELKKYKLVKVDLV